MCLLLPPGFSVPQERDRHLAASPVILLLSCGSLRWVQSSFYGKEHHQPTMMMHVIFFFPLLKVCSALLRSFEHIVIAAFLLFTLSPLFPSTDINFSLKTPGSCRLLISCIFIFSLLEELLRWGAYLNTSQIPLCVSTVYIYLGSTDASQEWKLCHENTGDNYF